MSESTEAGVQIDQIEGILEFLRSAERLKTVTRSGWTTTGDRESVAEHTWRLCLMAMLLYEGSPRIDMARLLKICLVHDLGEALRGDIPAPAQASGGGKAEQERADLLELTQPLSEPSRLEILKLWEDYESGNTPEGRLAKGLDKLETILQHNQGLNPPDFDYAFNLAYGRSYTAVDPLMSAVRRRLDEETARRATA